MKLKLSSIFVTLLLIIGGFLIFLPKTQAQENILRIISLRVSTSDNTATIYWSTNFPTTGRINFGPTNGFGSWITDNQLANYHETTLGGLSPDVKYYFELEASTQDNRIVKTDIYTFETLAEDDEKAPTVSDVHTSFVTGNTATFVWLTNENSDSCVRYSTNRDDLNKHKCSGSRVLNHDLTVTGLTRNTLYYYKVESKDRAGNSQSSVIYNFQTAFEQDENIPELRIYELTPFNRQVGEDTSAVVLELKTNRPVEGYISYGTKSGKYPKKTYLNAPRSVITELKLGDLEPDTTYYYKLYLKDVLGKELRTPEFTFKTLPVNLLDELPTEEIFNYNDAGQDFDHDGLTNAQEEQYKTDPIKADTDGDGYNDGIEVAHGYDPLGPGRLPVLPQTNFAYGKTRLPSLQTEQNLATDLKNRLENYFDKQIPKSTQHWHTLVNAYIYGNYPIEAIAKAIQYGGKTVHPTIPWSAWQKSNDYQTYINRQ